jgi:pyruvate-formate lyase-activating enzyme
VTLRNDLLLLSRAAAAGWKRPAFPWKLTYVLTHRCNLQCSACRIWEDGREGPPPERIGEFFARSNRFSWVDLTGGEIFLRDDLAEIFRIVLRECRRLAVLHFPTNGFLPDRIVSRTRELLAMRPPRVVVTVSVDGPPDVHDRLRGTEGSFERAVDCWSQLRELPGCDAFLGMTLLQENRDRIEETIEAVRKRAPRAARKDLHVNLANRSPHYYGAGASASPEAGDVAPQVRGFRRRLGLSPSPHGLVERRLLSLGEEYLASGRCPVPCQALAASAFVGVDGRLYPCVTWDRPLGTLAGAGHDLGELLSAGPAREARREIEAGRCPHCWTACEAVPSLLASWGRLRY